MICVRMLLEKLSRWYAKVERLSKSAGPCALILLYIVVNYSSSCGLAAESVDLMTWQMLFAWTLCFLHWF